MNVIDVNGLYKSYGARLVLDGLAFAVAEGEKVGVIGRNGCGKSTLLRVLAGEEDADGGEVMRKRGLTAAYLPQEPELDPDLTIAETLERALAEARRNLARFYEIAARLPAADADEGEKLLAEQQALQLWLDHHGAWDLGHRIADISGRFGIVDPTRRVGELSGGWVKKVALAAMFLREPELLLFDEPTNHLDAETVAALEIMLCRYPGAVMLVTHDRYFLDRVVGRMFELEQGVLTQYQGNYSDYLRQKQERLEAEGRAQGRLMNLLRREEAWLHRGAKARTTKQKARIGRVEGLRGQKKDLRVRDVKLEFAAEQRLGGTILEFQDLEIELGGRRLVAGLSFILRKGERIGILGPNGCGKTSLLRTVLGELKPAAGEVVVGSNTRIGYLDQARSGLDPEQFVHEALGEGEWVEVAGRKRHKIGYLEDFLFPAAEQRKRISTLSGGERARLLLACLMLKGANLLILDEPTNDLDIPTMQVLEEAFADFSGCVLVVTHDRWFLDRIATGILHFEEAGRVAYYEGNYEDFLRFQELRTEDERQARKLEVKPAVVEPKARKKTGLGYKEKRELEAVEREIAELEQTKADYEGLLADPARLGDHLRLAEVAESLQELDSRLEQLFERWEELETRNQGG
ncbi:ABC-F family ATP-binding cassette domain-containing protein [Trichloromonas sp.]|uniref:ABC-F family ATP-binding cassette domain-containing protein n=1 Tax=Trichloromonas sp. TaxID=3069249 RepID=UPI002A4DF8D0|nr:ABC-F family ATP-binding cassette domain-containing protein [Trichloromonas sp.]